MGSVGGSLEGVVLERDLDGRPTLVGVYKFYLSYFILLIVF